MASRPVGVSLSEQQVARADALAKNEGVSRSALIGRLIERAASSAPDVRVDGRRFVPEKKKR